ncbi:hypothetical protein DFH06DRAFT_1142643 [Mycena polygramma]|nr:hypothetical protein DFH06DRAFT_1142643 [Mycena polygramma]
MREHNYQSGGGGMSRVPTPPSFFPPRQRQGRLAVHRSSLPHFLWNATLEVLARCLSRALAQREAGVPVSTVYRSAICRQRFHLLDLESFPALMSDGDNEWQPLSDANRKNPEPWPLRVRDYHWRRTTNLRRPGYGGTAAAGRAGGRSVG